MGAGRISVCPVLPLLIAHETMAKVPKPPVHCSKGAYVGGDWVNIEDCVEAFNMHKRCGGETEGKCAACPRSRTRVQSAHSDGSYDVVVIGAGCIGGAVARELSKTKARVLVLEAADDVSQGATKGNSGIVHAGYDDKPGSVRAKFCWPGNQMFPQLDRELHFGYERNGSLVIACGKEDEAILEDLMERGRKNGVENLRIIDGDEVRQMEPFVTERCTKALHAPDAGTIIPYEFTIAMCENAADNGVEFRIRREVVGIDTKDGRYHITAKHWEPAPSDGQQQGGGSADRSQSSGSGTSDATVAPSDRPSAVSIPLIIMVSSIAVGILSHLFVTPLGSLSTIVLSGIAMGAAIAHFLSNRASAGDQAQELPSADAKPPCDDTPDEHEFSPSPGTVLRGAAEEEQIDCDYIVNCAGCQSDKIARMVGDSSFVIKPRLGEYILLHKKEGHKARCTLFPTPHPVLGKGVLVQSTLWGNLILGPTARDTLVYDEVKGEWIPNTAVLGQSSDEIMSYILSRARRLVPSLNAAEVIHTFSGARAKSTRGDWIIEPCETSPNLIHAAGIDSPGIAGCPAIAVEIVRLLKEAGAPVDEANESFSPFRAPLVKPKNVWKGLKAGPVGKYTNPSENVVCKCEKVTEEEVVEALHRSLPVDSTQGVRKRTRAGMGHCQGDPENYNCEVRVRDIIARELGVGVEQVGMRPWPASSMLSKRWVDDSEKEHIGELGK